MKDKKKWLLSLCILFCLVLSIPAVASAKGWSTENGITYYYKSNGQKYTGGPKKINKKLYLFAADGSLIKNQVTSYKNKLYLSKSDGSLLTGWGKVNGNRYYGTSKGYLKTGLQTYKKNYYYFSKKTGAALKNSWKKVGKANYYFTGTGKAVKNKIYTIDGNKYYFDSKGKRGSRVIKVGKYYYGFGVNTGKMLYKWATFGTSTYYFSTKDGRAVTGWKKISGKRYYFNSYAIRQTGWLVIGTKRYYLDPKDNGAQVFGKKKIDGKTYDFGTKGYVTYKPSGKMRIEVNRKQNVVTIYDGDIPVKAMTCSTGLGGSASTPTGTFHIYQKHAWWVLNGPSYGQYCSRFLPEYLFHSVPVYGTSRNPYGVNSTDYNRLGSPASGGCIRLCVADVKWIYYNVPIGSTVIISDTAKTPLGKPAVVKMSSGYGADPTDDFHNPEGYDR